jgi:type II secretory pathway pseudopilin PulG
MRTRLRAEAGIGLVELLIAMTILAVALLALVAAFSSGALTLQRAGQTSTASALANQQMELYRGLKYCAIRLDDSASNLPGPTPYTSDAAYSASQVLDTAVCGGSAQPCAAGPPPECDASRDVPASASPDKRNYRVDTYIVYVNTPPAREHKKVTVVVRDADNLTAAGLVRTSSKFDQISG